MDIRTCLQVLDLPLGASPDQIRQAYRELVAIWHPDRFANNPRLRQRAEAKLKEINQAYEMLETSGSLRRPSRAGDPHHARGEAGMGDVEAVAELGTRMFLDFCSRLVSAVRRLRESTIATGPAKRQEFEGRKPRTPP